MCELVGFTLSRNSVNFYHKVVFNCLIAAESNLGKSSSSKEGRMGWYLAWVPGVVLFLGRYCGSSLSCDRRSKNKLSFRHALSAAALPSLPWTNVRPLGNGVKSKKTLHPRKNYTCCLSERSISHYERQPRCSRAYAGGCVRERKTISPLASGQRSFSRHRVHANASVYSRQWFWCASRHLKRHLLIGMIKRRLWLWR